MLEPDMNIVQNERNRIIEEAKALRDKNKLGSINRAKDREFDATESDDSVELVDYYDDISSACCSLDEI